MCLCPVSVPCSLLPGDQAARRHSHPPLVTWAALVPWCQPSCCAGRWLQVDTSGTAKAVVKSFNKMGLPYTEASTWLQALGCEHLAASTWLQALGCAGCTCTAGTSLHACMALQALEGTTLLSSAVACLLQLNGTAHTSCPCAMLLLLAVALCLQQVPLRTVSAYTTYSSRPWCGRRRTLRRCAPWTSRSAAWACPRPGWTPATPSTPTH